MYKEVNGRFGHCKFLAKDEYVGRSMYYYGEYGPDETIMILSLANRVCLDIGANIGCISQALVSNGFVVHAFEPQPQVFALLCENTPSATHYNVAVGETPGTATMPVVHYSDKNNFGGIGLFDKSIYGNYTVPVVTIDSYNFSNVGFIKIDVEGFELSVLKGATETITRCKPIMYIEDDRAAKSSALRSYIVSLGYSIEEHKPTLYSPDNFFGLKKNVWNRNYCSSNLICKPLC